jgi:hypothetical protein
VHLSGLLDWNNTPWDARIKLSGTNLTFPKVAGLESGGDAEILLHLQRAHTPIFTGNLVIKNIQGTLPSRVTPFFAPPGISINSHTPLFPYALSHSVGQQAQLDFFIKSEGMTPLGNSSSSDPVKMQVDLHLEGMINALRWRGAISSRNLVAELPSGNFYIPEARWQYDEAGQGENHEELRFTAYGLTQHGLCILQQKGEIQDSAPSLDLQPATPGITAADMVLMLATPEKKYRDGSLLFQMPAWIQQNKLFAVPPVGWMTRGLGKNNPRALGLYGNPWAFNLQREEEVIPPLQQEKRSSKN